MKKIFKLLSQDKEPSSRKEIIYWWEKNRIIYNLIIGIVGLVLLILIVLGLHNRVQIINFSVLLIPICIYALGANFFYTSGSISEMIIRKYIPDSGIIKIGPILFVIGTTLSVLLTFFLAIIFFFGHLLNP